MRYTPRPIASLVAEQAAKLKAGMGAPRKRGKQAESTQQRLYVKALNQLGIGFFYRVKNMGTFDPARRLYRKHGDMEAIPDICGYTKNGQAVFIEVKHVEKIEAKKKLVFAVRITDEQCAFLRRAAEQGCRAGVAFTLEDCLAIATGDGVRYPRHPRTYAYLTKPEREIIALEYTRQRAELAEKNRDPLTRDIVLACPDPEEDWEAIPQDESRFPP